MERVKHIAKSQLPPRRLLRVGLFLISVGLMIRFVAVSLPEVKDSFSRLGDGNVSYLLAAVGVQVIWTVALSRVYRSGLRAFGGDVSRKAVLRVSMASFSISRMVPGGGAAGSAWAARELVKEGNTAPRTVISMMASWWISMTSLAIVVTTAIAVSVALGRISAVYLYGPAAALLVFSVGAIVIGRLLKSTKVRSRMVRRIAPAMSRFDIMANQLEAELGSVASGMRLRNLIPVGGWAMLSWIVDAAALAFTFAAFGSTLDIGVLMVGYGLANLISVLPELTPGWLGVLEATLAGTYGAFGVPQGTAILAVLAYRLASYWLPVFAGLVPAAAALKLGRKRQWNLGGKLRALVPAIPR